MEAVFKESVYTVIDKVRHVIQSDDDILFRVGTDLMEDGSYQYGDDIIISNVPSGQYEKNLYAFIKSKLKIKEAIIKSDLKKAMNNMDFGKYTKDCHLQLDAKIYSIIKSIHGYTIKGFITKAILEKLERDNLI